MSLFRPEVAAIVPYPESPAAAAVRADLNEGPWDWPESLKEEAARIVASTPFNRYSADEKRLTAALARRWEVNVASVIVGNGSEELILAVFLATLGAGRTLLLPRPSYRRYAQMAPISGGKAIELSMEGDVSYRPEAWLEAIRRVRPHLVLICSPNNPSGACFPAEALSELLESAPGLVAIDEAYAEFAGNDARSFLDRHENLVLLRTFSKAWGSAGLRLGYLLGNPSVTAQIRKVLLPFRLNAIAMRLGLLALRNAVLFEDRILILISERDRLFKGLAALPNVEAYPSRANFILIRLRSRSASEVHDQLRDRGILVRQFPSLPEVRACLRITVGAPAENDLVLRTLREVIS